MYFESEITVLAEIICIMPSHANLVNVVKGRSPVYVPAKSMKIYEIYEYGSCYQDL